MKTLEKHNPAAFDKPTWGDGPWQVEPDYKQWVDDMTKLPCFINRGLITGALCGYVGVPPDHPAYGGKHPDMHLLGDLANYRLHLSGIGHFTPELEPGEERDLWLFGFDCAHAGDISPAQEPRLVQAGVTSRYVRKLFDGWTYKAIEHVVGRVEVLAAALFIFPKVWGYDTQEV